MEIMSGLSQNDILLIGGALISLLMFVFALAGSSPRDRIRKRALKLAERNKKSPARTLEEEISLRRKKNEPVSPFLNLLMKPLPDIRKLEARLQRMGSSLNPKQYILRCLLAALVIAFLVKIMGKPLLLGVFLGVILAGWLPLKVMDSKIAKKQKKFLELFPDAIDLIVRGLRSGLPVSESIVLVSQEVPDPVSGVFRHVTDTMHLGVSLEKALQEVAKQLDYTELNFFVTSIILQRETGGNLSEILSNLSDVLRKRHLMKMKIKAMTSEARASAIIVGALPFFVAGAVSVMSPGYLKPLFTDYRGNIALLIAGGMLFGGIGIMRRMAKFDI